MDNFTLQKAKKLEHEMLTIDIAVHMLHRESRFHEIIVKDRHGNSTPIFDKSQSVDELSDKVDAAYFDFLEKCKGIAANIRAKKENELSSL